MSSQPAMTKAYLSNPHLWPAVVQYNTLALRSIHPSWLPSLKHYSFVEKARLCERSHLRLSKYILNQLNIEQQNETDFSSPEKRLLLLNGDLLQQIIFLAGATHYRNDILPLIDGAMVRKIRSSIGDRVYLFVVKKSPFLLPNLPALNPTNEEKHEKLDILQDETQIKQQVERAGLAVLSNIVGNLSPANQQRLVLKLPKAWEAHALAQSETPADDVVTQSIDTLIRLSRETIPSCHHLFI